MRKNIMKVVGKRRQAFASKTDGYSNCDAVSITEFALANLICEQSEQSNIT